MLLSDKGKFIERLKTQSATYLALESKFKWSFTHGKKGIARAEAFTKELDLLLLQDQLSSYAQSFLKNKQVWNHEKAFADLQPLITALARLATDNPHPESEKIIAILKADILSLQKSVDTYYYAHVPADQKATDALMQIVTKIAENNKVFYSNIAFSLLKLDDGSFNKEKSLKPFLSQAASLLTANPHKSEAENYRSLILMLLKKGMIENDHPIEIHADLTRLCHLTHISENSKQIEHIKALQITLLEKCGMTPDTPVANTLMLPLLLNDKVEVITRVHNIFSLLKDYPFDQYNEEVMRKFQHIVTRIIKDMMLSLDAGKQCHDFYAQGCIALAEEDLLNPDALAILTHHYDQSQYDIPSVVEEIKQLKSQNEQFASSHIQEQKRSNLSAN